MRISYIRGLGLKNRKFWIPGAIAIGLLSACGSQATGVDGNNESTGTSYQRWVSPPAVGPEIGTDPPVPVEANIGYNTEVASDGTGFLTVETIGASIRGSRVDGNGQVLDLDWLDFGPGSKPSGDSWHVEQFYPSVTFGDGHYLVLWSEYESDAQSNSQDRGTRARLVNPDGTLVGTENFEVGGGPTALYANAVWDGQHFVVTWLGPDANEQYGVFVSLLNADGSRVAGSERQVSTRPNVTNPRIGYGSNHTFLAWEEYTTSPEGFSTGYALWGTRISSAGLPLDPGGLELSGPSTSEINADVAVSDTDVLVVFQTYQSPYSVRGTLVSHSGEVTSRDFAISHSIGDAGLPSVAFDGTNYLVAWADARDEQEAVYGVKVAPGGAPLSTTDVKLATASPRYVGFGSDHTNVAWNGSRYLVSFLGDPGIQGSLLEKDLVWVNGSIPLTAVPNKQDYPVSTWNGQSYVLTWADERDSSTEMALRAVRIDTNGKLLDPNGIGVSPAENPAFSYSLGSIGDGSALFVWDGTSGGPKLRMMSSSGALSAVTTFSDEDMMTVPAVASDGTGYLAVFGTGDSSDGQVFGQLLDAKGAPSPRFKISATTFNTSPSVFRAESGYWVSYSNSGTWLMPVSKDGQAGTPLQLSQRPVWFAGIGGPSNALIVWSELDSKVIQARFLEAGVFSGEPIEIASQTLGYGAVGAWDGSAYWLVWETENHYLQGRSLSTDGTLGEPSTWVAADCTSPALTSDGQGQLLLSYMKYSDGYMARRVYSRLVGRGVTTQPPSVDGGAGGAPGTSDGGTGGVTVGSAGTIGTAGANAAGNSAGGGTTGAGGNAGGSTAKGGSSGVGGMTGIAGAIGIGGFPAVNVKCGVGAPGQAPGSRGVIVGLGIALATAAARRRRARA